MSGPLAVPGRPSILAVTRMVLITAGLVTAYYVVPLSEHSTAAASALLLGGVLGVFLVFAWEVWAILRSPHPRLKAVEALVITLALFVVLFASTYYVLDDTRPGSFSEALTKTDALYFALSTFATVGYGDITAISQLGRVVTMLQMTCGLLLAGVAVRILTSAMELGLRRRAKEPPPEPGAGRSAGQDRP
ncbi:potassium channel family protein [Streptomyces sp. HUAS TT20]|uniref:potassium channel family protein n=1 Tax=Streptomyces sp. HUAS TT20 TaxID=3447509 RepID=UPI0021D9DB98|nr:potassium channel family protein [Streptomyces sp. HUAS 15-9]UXY31572.1 potassium channel family protein [Streptomyces sp. HUAS 15-9]